MKNNIVISLGGNMPQTNSFLLEAFVWLRKYIHNIRTSEIYSTRPLNGVGNDYLNAVVIGETELSINDVNSQLKQYEKEFGRTSESKIKSQIPIDLDIVVYGSRIIRDKDFNQEFFQIGYQQIINTKD